MVKLVRLFSIVSQCFKVDPSLTLNEQSMNLKYDTDWEFPFERLVLGDRLGAGAFGEVYKAEAMGILALNPRDKSSIGSKRRSKIRRSLRASQRPKKKQIPADLSNATVAVKTVKGISCMKLLCMWICMHEENIVPKTTSNLFSCTQLFI